MLQSQIISIGDELLLGDTVNTNASWISGVLTTNGVEPVKIHAIRDVQEEIVLALREATTQADIVIVTGGLGPTQDDKTKQVVAYFLDETLVTHQPTLEHIQKTFKKRGIPFSKSNYGQAEVPEACEVLFNKQGTAPGMWFEKESYHLAVLPGIPSEMKALMNDEVLPRIKTLMKDPERKYFSYLKTAGVGESTLSDEVLPELDRFLTNELSLASLPSPMGDMLRVTTKAKSMDEAEKKAQPLINYIYENAGDYIIGEGEDVTLSEVVGGILREESLTISTAESCTGGMLASRLTDVPGSSDYMMGGITAYANSVKMNQLNVSEQILDKYGAVSKQVALKMAKAVAERMNTGVGVSTTGIAGPGGGSDEKPVGTIWVGFWSEEAHFALRTQFSKNRLHNKKRTVALALEMVRRKLLNIRMMPYGLKPYRV